MKTVLEFKKKKENGEKIAVVTVYDFTIASVFNDSLIDCLLVGDSLAMVMHGFPSTIHATNELIALHTAAVSRGAPDKFIISDMPFLSCRKGLNEAMHAVDALIKAGASAVKVEGIAGHQEIITHIVDSGVPVMGHLGLMPQSVHTLGGYRVQGTEDERAEVIFNQAMALEELGCFSMVLECIPWELAARITRKLCIPTIGIGAGAQVDGQVLVWQDMFGLTNMNPKFLKHYIDGGSVFREAINTYCREVKAGEYPQLKHSYP